MACLTASCGFRCWRTGFQTFGDDYDIDKPTVDITVKMKRPQGQYSIYEDHPGDKKTSREPQKQPDQRQAAVEHFRFRILDCRLKRPSYAI